MADFFGLNATKRDSDVPAKKIYAGEVSGKLRIAYDEFTLTAELDPAAVTDNVFFMEIPKGARVHEVILKSEDMGTTGTFNLGWEASVESGAEVADPNGLLSLVALTTAGGDVHKLSDNAALAGFNKEFSEAVRVVLQPTIITDAGTGQKIELTVFYTVE